MNWQKTAGTFAGIGVLIICGAIAYRIVTGATLTAEIEDWNIALQNSSQTLEQLKARLAVAEENCLKTQAVVETAKAQLDVIGDEPNREALQVLRAAIDSPLAEASVSADFGSLQTEIDHVNANLQDLGSQLLQNIS